LEQHRNLLRVEFEVGILNRDDRSRRTRQPASDGAALPAISLGKEDRRGNAIGFGPGQDLTRSVSRSVVDDQDLALHRKIDREQPINHRADGAEFVVDRDDDRDAIDLGHRSRSLELGIGVKHSHRRRGVAPRRPGAGG